MKASEIIARLSDLINEHGDLEVTVTDGYNGHCYRANKAYPKYEIEPYTQNDTRFIDIGIGGMLEDI